MYARVDISKVLTKKTNQVLDIVRNPDSSNEGPFKGLLLMSWKSAWKKVKKAVKKAAKAVEDFANEVGNAVGSAVEAIGDGVNDILHAVGNWAEKKLGKNWVGKGISSMLNWVGGLVKGGFDVLGAVIKGVFGIIGGVISGVMQVLGGIIIGIFTWGDFGLLGDGLLDIVSSILGTVVVVGGKVIELVQSIVLGFMSSTRERQLSKDEEAALKRVFKDSLYYYLIRIVDGHSGVFQISRRPFTLGNTIYLKNKPPDLDRIIHEGTHVWQYQNLGIRYASDAIGAQWFVDDGYDWEKEINDRRKENWSEFNKEAQGQFFQDLWLIGILKDPAGNLVSNSQGSFFDANGNKGYFEYKGTDYTGVANDTVEIVRNDYRI